MEAEPRERETETIKERAIYVCFLKGRRVEDI